MPTNSPLFSIPLPSYDKRFVCRPFHAFDDEHLELVKLDCDKASVEGVLFVPEKAKVPGEYKGGKITKISGRKITVEIQKFKYEEKLIGAFEGCPNLTKIILPNSVTEVTNENGEPFENCPLLECIQLSRGAKYFSICASNVKRIILPEGLESLYLKSCRDLLEVNLPSTLKTLSIDGCEQLKTMYQDESHNIIDGSHLCIPKFITSFYLTNNQNFCSLLLHEKVEHVNIQNCENLTQIDIDASNERLFLKDGVLYSKHKREGILVRYIYPNIEKVRITEGVLTLSSGIQWPEKMNEIFLPSTLNKIYKKTFYGCNHIKEIVIPLNVDYIGSEAFNKCSSLERVIVLNKTPFKLACGNEH